MDGVGSAASVAAGEAVVMRRRPKSWEPYRITTGVRALLGSAAWLARHWHRDHCERPLYAATLWMDARGGGMIQRRLRHREASDAEIAELGAYGEELRAAPGSDP